MYSSSISLARSNNAVESFSANSTPLSLMPLVLAFEACSKILGMSSKAAKSFWLPCADAACTLGRAPGPDCWPADGFRFSRSLFMESGSLQAVLLGRTSTLAACPCSCGLEEGGERGSLSKDLLERLAVAALEVPSATDGIMG
eukprot:g32379.t1